MRHLGIGILTALLCSGAGVAVGGDAPQAESAKPWISVTIPAGIKVAVASEKALYRTEAAEALFTGPCKVTAKGFELRVRGNVRSTGGKPGQPTVIEVPAPEDSARLSFPYSPELIVEASKVNYKPEMMGLEASGTLKFRLPQGIAAEIRSAHAVSGPMKPGVPVELTLTHEPVALTP